MSQGPATHDSESRSARRKRGEGGRVWWVMLAGAVLAVVSVTVFAILLARGLSTPPRLHAATPRAVAATEEPAPSALSTATMVEVPELMGLGVDEAKMVLQAAGLTPDVSVEGTITSDRPTVTGQDPAPGGLVTAASAVRISVPALAKSAKTVSAKKPSRVFVVCIDPGHQSHSDPSPEPLGPGSTETRPKISGGATGVSTGVPEYEVALQIATNLQQRLQGAGVQVVMTRTTNDVNISNSERAIIANQANADLFVRIHADSTTDPQMCGVATLYPADNVWTKPIHQPSESAALAVQSSLVQATGAVDRGATERADLLGFNWAKVPSVLVQTGYLSNEVEDKLLTSPHYQDAIADGIARGVLTYLNGAR